MTTSTEQGLTFRKLDPTELNGLGTDQLRVARELDRLTESVVATINTGYSRARAWRLVHLILSPLTAALAGVAGLTGISEIVGPQTAGIIALGAAVVAATEGALSPTTRATQARDSAEAFIALRDEIRQFAYLRLREIPINEATVRTETLANRVHEIGQKSDPPGVIMWWRIRRGKV